MVLVLFDDEVVVTSSVVTFLCPAGEALQMLGRLLLMALVSRTYQYAFGRSSLVGCAP